MKYKSWIEVNYDYNMTLYSMLYYGVKSNHAASFESMPINGISGIEKEENYLVEYLRKKKPQETFIPIMKAVNDSYRKITKNRVSDIKKVKSSQTYNINNFKTYKNTLFEEILKKIDQAKTYKQKDELVKNAGNWALSDLQKQSASMIGDICNLSKIKCQLEFNYDHTGNIFDTAGYNISMNFKDFVDQISKSHHLLNPEISHNCDRLHVIAALLDNNKNYLKFADGNHSMREFYEELINTLANDPSEERAITAEQMYVKLITILHG